MPQNKEPTPILLALIGLKTQSVITVQSNTVIKLRFSSREMQQIFANKCLEAGLWSKFIFSQTLTESILTLRESPNNGEEQPTAIIKGLLQL